MTRPVRTMSGRRAPPLLANADAVIDREQAPTSTRSARERSRRTRPASGTRPGQGAGGPVNPLARPRLGVSAEDRQRHAAAAAALAAGAAQLDPVAAERARPAVTANRRTDCAYRQPHRRRLRRRDQGGKIQPVQRRRRQRCRDHPARRPTTSKPRPPFGATTRRGPAPGLARVDNRHQVGTGGSLDGLVLLDLPTSTPGRASTRPEAEHMCSNFVDVFVGHGPTEVCHVASTTTMSPQ